MKKILIILLLITQQPGFAEKIKIEADSENISHRTMQIYMTGSGTNVNETGLLKKFSDLGASFYPDMNFEFSMMGRISNGDIYKPGKFFYEAGLRLVYWDLNATLPLKANINFGYEYDLDDYLVLNGSIGYGLTYTVLEADTYNNETFTYDESLYTNFGMQYNIALGVDFRIIFHENWLFRNNALLFGVTGRYNSTFVEVWNKMNGSMPQFFKDQVTLEFKFGFEHKQKIIEIPYK